MLRTALRWKSFYQLPLTLPHKQLHLPRQCCAWIDNNISSEFWEKLSKANHQRLSRGLGMQLEKQTNSETQRGGKHEKATVLHCVWPKTLKIGQSNRRYLKKQDNFHRLSKRNCKSNTVIRELTAAVFLPLQADKLFKYTRFCCEEVSKVTGVRVRR